MKEMEMKTKNGKEKMSQKQKTTLLFSVLVVAIILLAIVAGYFFFKQIKNNEDEKPYTSELERRIAGELERNNTVVGSVRPDYLPEGMFSRLPPMPDDFYQIRTLVKSGRINDLSEVNESYWLQPEFFPHFEDIGLELLQNPTPGRWGAYGIAVYPSDSVAVMEAGQSVDVYFLIKSNYLVETYQGINLVPVYPGKAEITSGYSMPDGSSTVHQNETIVAEYFDVEVDPGIFVLEPNFPVYNVNGTQMVKVTVNVSTDAKPGNYVVGLDTTGVPSDIEQAWLKKYLTAYTGTSMTKLNRPYYQIFLTVTEGGEN